MDMWTIGVADRLRFPRFPSKLEKRGNARFAHIPTGPTLNQWDNINEMVDAAPPLPRRPR